MFKLLIIDDEGQTSSFSLKQKPFITDGISVIKIELDDETLWINSRSFSLIKLEELKNSEIQKE